MLICIAACAGCAQVRVPAIDPTGARILAPYDTTLANPVDSSAGCRLFPRPAFSQPAAIPPCPEPPPALPIAPGYGAVAAPVLQPSVVCPPAVIDPCAPVLTCPPLVQGEPECPPAACYPAPAVIAAPPPVAAAPPVARAAPVEGLAVSPARVIAGVGTEVVFRAAFDSGKGGCGKTVEWVLAEGSVGHLVDVGNDSHHFFCSHSKDRQTGTFKVGKALKKAQVLPRNPADPRDDLTLAPGESWVSVTSPTEGVSYVSALSPDVTGWNALRQTATVFWIDAQWALPLSTTVPAGGRHVLTTSLRRASTGAPIAGWIVRYQVVGGPPAGFGPTGAASADIPTDAAGAATVELVQASPQAGGTQVRIQVIRPAQSGNLPEITVGEGLATIFWSAPGLAVNVTGPTQVALNGEANYRVEVSNPGDLVASGVVVTDAPPPGLAFVGSNPAGELFGERLQWRIGDLPPKASRVIEIQMRAAAAGDVRHCVRANTADNVSAEGCALTRIFAQSLSVVITGPQQAQVGQTVTYQIDVTNSSDAPLDNVVVVDRFDAGIRHAQGELSPLSRNLGQIAPRQTQRLSLDFVVVSPGQWSHTLEATAAGGQRTVAQAWLTALQSAPAGEPALQVRKTGPSQKRQGEVAEYIVEVVNTGEVTLTNVRVADVSSPSLAAAEATPNFLVESGALVWNVPELAPRAMLRFQVNCNCLRPDPAAENSVTVTCDQNVTMADRVKTQILAAASPPAEPEPDDPLPGRPPAGSRPPTTPPAAVGELSVKVFDLSDPVRIGQKVTYSIAVTNARNVSDREIEVTIHVPRGMKVESLSKGMGVRRTSEDGRIVYVTPIAELRAGEAVTGELVVTAVSPGAHTLLVRVVSQRTRTPIEVQEGTTVFQAP